MPRTGSLLPWRPVGASEVTSAALASSGKKIYLAGAFKRVSGRAPSRPRRGQRARCGEAAAVASPALPGIVRIACRHARTRVRRRIRQAAWSEELRRRSATFSSSRRQPADRLPFDSRIGHVSLMALGHRLVLAERSCDSRRHRDCVPDRLPRGRGRAARLETIDSRAGSSLFRQGLHALCRGPVLEHRRPAQVEPRRTGARQDRQAP